MTDEQLIAAAIVVGIVLLGAIALAVFLRRRRAAAERPSTSRLPEPTCEEVVQIALCALAAGNPERATYSLARYIDRAGARDRRQQPWDLLLDLYYNAGDRDRYRKLAKRYRRTFGTRLPAFESWPEYFLSPGDLEQGYPRLMDELRRSWDSGRALAFIDGLLDQLGRPGRPALSGAAVRELALLRGVLIDRRKADERAGEEAGGPAAQSAAVQGGTDARAGGESAADKTGPATNLAYKTLDPEAYQSALEANFARIASQLENNWPGRAALDHLDSLIIDDRGTRAGFPPDVMAEILLLREIISRRHPPGEKEAWHKLRRSDDS